MLIYKEGLKLATEKLNIVSQNSPEYVIWEDKTVIKEYGWIFRPESKKFIANGYRGARVPGIGLILVNKFDSTCVMMPSSVSPTIFIQDYEKKRAGQ